MIPESIRQTQEQFLAIRSIIGGDGLSTIAWLDLLETRLILVGGASAYEQQLSSIVLRFASKFSGGDVRLTEFVRVAAVERKYHTWFDWDKSNVNKFLGMFGDDFKSAGIKEIEKDSTLKEASRSFVALGQARNLIVHGDMLSASISYSSQEAIDLVGRAGAFVAWVEGKLVPSIAPEGNTR